MKKLYAFLFAIATTLSMNAVPLYIVGAGDGLGWDPENPMVVNSANGEFNFSVTNLSQFKMSPTKGDWTAFDGSAFGCDVEESDLGKKLNTESKTDNIALPWPGDYTIRVAGDLSWMIVTTTTPKPQGFTDVYVRGDMNGWGTDDMWKMKTTDGKTYTFTCYGDTKITANTGFKLADANWGDINYGIGGKANIGVPEKWNYNANNSSLSSDFEGTITLTIPGKRQAATVLFTRGAGVSDIVVDGADAPAEYYNLQGVRVANPGAGLYLVRRGTTVTKELVK